LQLLYFDSAERFYLQIICAERFYLPYISFLHTKKSQQNARRKIANVCAGLDEFDDSGDDETYSPGECSNSSVESEDNTEISELIYKKEPVRKKACKRRGKTILSPQKFPRKSKEPGFS